MNIITWTPPASTWSPSPEMFDVIVTENMFGDIITDLAAITQGGLGSRPTHGNINPNGEHVRAIGGTARWDGQECHQPLAAIGAAA